MRWIPAAFVATFCALCLTPYVLAQPNQPSDLKVQGAAENRSTVNASVTITTANTFQTVLASNIGTSTQRQALEIQNNNTAGTDYCWIFIGSGTASEAKSIALAVGQSYTRYWPYVPSDAIQATCASNSDTLYVATE